MGKTRKSENQRRGKPVKEKTLKGKTSIGKNKLRGKPAQGKTSKEENQYRKKKKTLNWKPVQEIPSKSGKIGVKIAGGKPVKG